MAALSKIQNPRLENDLLSAGMIRDLAVTEDGAVAFSFLLGREDPGTLVREARKAVAAVEGVRADGIKITVVDPAGPTKVTHGPPQSAQAGVPAPSPSEMPELGRVIAVSSGKGGVGKSTVAANLAVALAQAGHRVAIMDADVYGPSIPRMFGINERPELILAQQAKVQQAGVRQGRNVAPASSAAPATSPAQSVRRELVARGLYCIQIGAFKDVERATGLATDLERHGFSAWVASGDGYERVLVGEFRTRSEAAAMELELRNAGFETWVRRVPSYERASVGQAVALAQR